MKTGLLESNTSVVLLGSEGGRDAGESGRERGRAGERERELGREAGERERERGGREGRREREGGRPGGAVDSTSMPCQQLGVDLGVGGKVGVSGDNTPKKYK